LVPQKPSGPTGWEQSILEVESPSRCKSNAVLKGGSFKRVGGKKKGQCNMKKNSGIITSKLG